MAHVVVQTGGIMSSTYDNDEYDRKVMSSGNMFKTKEEAEFEAERRKVYFELKKYVYEHDPRPITEKEWKTNCMKKYGIAYNHKLDNISFTKRECLKDIWTISASNEQTLMDAIAAIGEDRIKKYLFEVER